MTVFLAPATPWSPSTNEPVTAPAMAVVISDEADITSRPALD
jgi:hypothetical protein